MTDYSVDMNLLKSPLVWIGVAVVIGLLWLVGAYNTYVTQQNAIDGQWKQVEVQYQRRYDLIPNLVETVKGILTQEQKVFGDIAAARSQYAGAATPEQKVKAANQVEGALGRLLVIMENYPQLKSDQTMARLQDELAGTENRIAVERRRYNDLVQAYNTSLAVIPGRWFARVFGFTPRSYFEAAKGADQAPKVDFNK